MMPLTVIRRHRLSVLLWLAVLAGCTNPQPLQFTHTATAKLITGEQFTNPVLATDASVDYRSSDPRIARVNGQGVVTAVAPGQAVITASAPEVASVSYSVEIVDRHVTLNAWVGESESEVWLSAGQEGAELLASSDPDCDFELWPQCDQARRHWAGVSAPRDEQLRLTQPAFFALHHGEHRAELGLNAQRFGGRNFHQAAYFKGQFWVMGGLDLGDIWSSHDGVTWVLRVAQAPFSPVSYSQLVVYQGQLWAVNIVNRTVHASEDGVHWREVTLAANFPALGYSQVVVFDDGEAGERLWLIGGQNRNDVWVSRDGKVWQEKTDSAGFSARTDYRVVVFQNRLWVIGGRVLDEGYKNDVWSSADGETWRLETASADFSGRANHQVVVFDDGSGEQLWLLGGTYTINLALNDIWSSGDGIHWTQQRMAADFSPRYAFQVVVAQQRLWLIGGDGVLGLPYNQYSDVWASPDGRHWLQQSPQARFAGRYGHQMVAFADQLWLVGGYEGAGGGLVNYRNDVWSSSNGLNWQPRRRQAEFPARRGHQLGVFNGRLWLTGGWGDRYFNDVWSSADGLEWTLETEAAEFSARMEHQMVVFNDRLWLIGGESKDGPLNDVWSSADGRHWRLESAEAAFSPRLDHQVENFLGQLWLVGGRTTDQAGTGTNDVWSSTDGVHWQAHPNATPFPKRYGHQLVSLNEGGAERLWLIGGINHANGPYDAWTSSDGIHWTPTPTHPSVSKRLSFQALAFRQQLWVVGGYIKRIGNIEDFALNDIWKTADGVHWQQGLQVQAEYDGH